MADDMTAFEPMPEQEKRWYSEEEWRQVEDVKAVLDRHRQDEWIESLPTGQLILHGDCSNTGEDGYEGHNESFTLHQARHVFEALKPEPQVGVCASALVLRGPLVLLVERLDGLGWAPPGGRVDFGEPVPHAAVRETSEECGIVVGAGPVVGVIDWHDPDLVQHWTVWYVGCRWLPDSPDVRVCEPTKHSNVRWVHRDMLDDMPLVPSFERLREQAPNWYDRVPNL